MVSRYSAYRRGSDTIPPDVIDRILVGACAAIWLVLLGVSVAAAVALADLGRGFHRTAGSSHTTWVLYAVIIVSALIIAGAIPVLLRARRMAQVDPAVRSVDRAGAVAGQNPVKAGRCHRARLGGARPPAHGAGRRAGRRMVGRGGGPSLVARHGHTGGHDGCRADCGRGGDLPDGRRSRRRVVGRLRAGRARHRGDAGGGVATCPATAQPDRQARRPSALRRRRSVG